MAFFHEGSFSKGQNPSGVAPTRHFLPLRPLLNFHSRKTFPFSRLSGNLFSV